MADTELGAGIIRVAVDGTDAVTGAEKVAQSLERIEKAQARLAAAQERAAAASGKSAKQQADAAAAVESAQKRLDAAVQGNAKAIEEASKRKERAAARAAKAAEDAAEREARAAAGKTSRVISEAEREAKEIGRIRAQIIRETAAAQAQTMGGSQSARLESLIGLKGFDRSKFAAELDQLKKFEQVAGRGALSARELAFASRGLPAQFTDIATSLQAGQAPLTVFLQQGGQLKDMFGGVGNAARAMGGYIAGLVTPYTIAAAAAASLGLAYYKGSKEADEYAKALILTGNAAGSTSGMLASMAQNVSATSGATVGLAAEAVAGLAATGKVAAGNMELVAEAAINMQKHAGVAIEDTIKQFADLAGAPVDASLKLNETTNYLTESIYRQIKALEDQGKTTEAAALAQEAWADSLIDRAGRVEENLGYIQRAWRAVAAEIKHAIDEAAKFGRATTIDELKDRRQNAVNTGATAAEIASFDAMIAAAEKSAASKKQEAEAQALLNKQEKAGIALAEERAKHIDSEAKKLVEINKLYGKYLQSAQTPENTADYVASVQGILADKSRAKAPSRTERESVIIDATVKAYQDYGKAIEDLIGIQSKATIATKELSAAEAVREQLVQSGAWDKLSEEARGVVDAYVSTAQAAEQAAEAEKSYKKAREESIKTAQKEAQTLAEQVAKAREENEQIGLTVEQLDALKIARIDATIAAKEQALATLEAGSASAAEVQAILHQIDALEELRGIAASTSVKQANKRAVDEQAKAWENFSRDIEQSLTDALMRSFEAGDNFGEAFVKSLENTIKTAVLKMAVQVVLNPITGQGGLLQQGAQALGLGGQTGGAGGLINTASSAYSLFGNGATVAGMVDAFGTGMALTAAEAAAAASAYTAAGMTGIAGSLTAGATAGTAAGASAAGIGSAISGVGAALPWIGGALALGSAFGLFGEDDPDPKVGLTNASTQQRNSVAQTPFGWIGLRTSEMDEAQIKAARKITDQLAAVDSAIAKSLRSFEMRDAKDALADWKSKMLDFSGGAMRSMGMDRLRVINDQVDSWVADAVEQVIFAERDALKGADYKAKYGVGKNSKAAFASNTAVIDTLYGVRDEAGFEDLVSSIIDGGAEAFKDAGETTNGALVRMVKSLDVVNDAFDNLGTALYDISAAGADAASDLVAAFGSVEQFAAEQSQYFDLFYSAEEKLAAATRTMSAEFERLGLVMPSTAAGFRAMVEAIDLSTDAGMTLRADLMGIDQNFAAIMQQADEQVSKAQADLRSVYNDETRMKRDMIRDLKGYVSSLRDFRTELMVGDLSPLSADEKYGVAKAKYLEISAIAGDQENPDYLSAVARLPDTISTFLAASKEAAPDEMAFYRDFADANNVLENTATLAEIQIGLEEQQLAALEAQVGQLIDLNSNTLTLAQAMANLTGATVAKTNTDAQAMAAMQALMDSARAEQIASDAAATSAAQYAQSVSAVDAIKGISSKDVAKLSESAISAIAGNLASTPSTVKGVSKAELQQAITVNLNIASADLGNLGKADLKNIASSIGLSTSTIKSYDVGTPYVPQDMTANIHRGEIIVDPRSSDILRRYGIPNNSNVIDITPLIKRLDLIEAAVRATAGSSSKTAGLIERAMPDGDALATREAAAL